MRSSDSVFMALSPDYRGNRQEGCESGDVRVNIANMSLRFLRAAIQNNEVSFPAQIPTFDCQARSDIQWRLVELYFVRNWTCLELGRRYGVTMEWVRRLISNWVQRAVVLGYLQEIPALAATLVSTDAPEAVFVAANQVSVGPAPLPESLVHMTAASSRL